MLRRCSTLVALVAVALAVFASSSWGQSGKDHPKPKEPPPTTSESKQQATSEQRGTDESPSVVKILPAPQTAQQPAGKTTPKYSESTDEKKLARFTEGLFYATLGLSFAAFLQLLVFGWQGIQLRNTVRASENEFVATHRPKIRLKHLWVTSDVWHGNPIVVSVTYVNYGTANATFAQTGVRFVIVGRDRPIPFDPDIPTLEFAPPNREIPCGVNWRINGITDGTVLTEAQNVAIQDGESRLFCIGYVTYLDAAQRLRITGFCRVMEFPVGALAHEGNIRFRRVDDPDYDYED